MMMALLQNLINSQCDKQLDHQGETLDDSYYGEPTNQSTLYKTCGHNNMFLHLILFTLNFYIMSTQTPLRVIDKQAAASILQSRALITEGVIKNVPVTNVSFTDPKTNGPFQWEEGTSSAGQPYAIANFAIINDYGKAKAIEHFTNGDYQEAVNTNLSFRVTPEMGEALQEAMFASVVGAWRTVTDEETEEDVETILIKKVVPNKAKSFKDNKAFSADVFADPEPASGGRPDASGEE